MEQAARPFLLDATRLISRSWTGRRATGIDRVCYAYLDRFRDNARAVVQFGGVVRALGNDHSDMLFDLLDGPDSNFRKQLKAGAPVALLGRDRPQDLSGAIYINASHTDFDLSGHARWVETNGVRPVYFLHDLIPITHPEICRRKAVRRHTGRVRAALKCAAGIIVNSRSTADELRRFAGDSRLELPSVVAAPLAGAQLMDPNAIPSATMQGAQASGHVRPYFLCIGTIEPRKNYLMLLRVWERLVEKKGKLAPRLVIVGQLGQDARFVRKVQDQIARLGEHVELVAGCDDERLGQYVKHANALLMPTLAEGFGLPLVEALNAGTPVIASDLPALREMGQNIPLHLPPGNVEVWENAILSYDSPLSDRVRQMTLLPAYKAYSWDDHFNAVEPWLWQLPQPRMQLAESPRLRQLRS